MIKANQHFFVHCGPQTKLHTPYSVFGPTRQSQLRGGGGSLPLPTITLSQSLTSTVVSSIRMHWD